MTSLQKPESFEHSSFGQGGFPATPGRPATAFTFTVLDLFHELSVQGKISAHDFYHGIVHLVNNTGLVEIHVCLPFKNTIPLIEV